MNVDDIQEGMTVDVTVRGAVVESLDAAVGGRLFLIKLPGDKRQTASVWMQIKTKTYGSDGVELDAVYTKEPLGKSIAVDKNTDVWQRRPIIGDWMPTLDDDVIYNGLVNWRTLWKDHGPLRVLLDDTENEPKQRGEERVGDGAPEWEEKGSGD